MTQSHRLRRRLLRAAGFVRPPKPAQREPRSILIVRPDHLGDAILAAPAVAALGAAFPEARLTGWVGPSGAAVWRHVPALDALEVCDFPGFTRRAKHNAVAPYLQALREAARLYGRFDLALNLRADFWWGAMVGCWAAIPVVGYDLPDTRPFMSLAVAHTPGLHETDQALGLVHALNAAGVRTGHSLAAPTPPGFEARADALPAEPHAAIRWPDVPLPADLPADAIVLHVGSGAPVKLWDEARWAQLAGALQSEGHAVVLNAGEGEEHAAATRIAERTPRPARVVAGLTLEQLAAFYRRSRLVIGADSGPLHVARSVGTPTVALFGPIDPRQFGSRQQPDPLHEVVQLPWPCVPCRRLDYTPAELAYHLCVRLIEPERVLKSARRVLAARAARSS